MTSSLTLLSLCGTQAAEWKGEHGIAEKCTEYEPWYDESFTGNQIEEL